MARTYLLVATEAAKGRDYGRALETLKQGLEDHPDDADLADTLARVYAMCPEAAYRDWEEAMRIALTLYGGDEEEVSDRGLGTLAAAHAEAENFEEAIRLTKEGIRRAKLNQDAPLLRKLARNLVHYQQGLRLYEEPE